MFSKRAVVTMHDGELMLMFRLANQRRTHINQANINVVLAFDDTTAEGETTRRLRDITLRRNMSPTFVLSWTVRHVIDSASPFFGRTREELRDAHAELIVVFTGFHESFNQTVHARYAYAMEDIHWNHKLVDIFTIIQDGRRALDFSRFDLTVPEDASG
jgi:inward rectifier potassium channel